MWPAVVVALRALATAEERDLAAQATVLVTDGLKRLGYLAEDWRPGQQEPEQ